jgi:hypothetical protein
MTLIMKSTLAQLKGELADAASKMRRDAATVASKCGMPFLYRRQRRLLACNDSGRCNRPEPWDWDGTRKELEQYAAECGDDVTHIVIDGGWDMAANPTEYGDGCYEIVDGAEWEVVAMTRNTKAAQ